MANKHSAWTLAILLLGAGLRFHALGQNVRLHPDEALFVMFARQAAVQGDWLLHGTLDKPPLTIYVNALAMTAFGITPLPDGVMTLDIHLGEFSVRAAGVFASVLLMAVVYALAKRLYPRDWRTSRMAILLAALSPLAVAFSATAFTDGLMLLCVTLALWMGIRRRWLWAGVWLVVGFWCKQQAVLYVPLVVAIGWLCERRARQHVSLDKWLRLGAPIVVGIILLGVWDSSRGQTTSLWTLATTNNDPGRLAKLDEMLPRLSAWWGYGQYLAGSAVVTAILVLVGVVMLAKRAVAYRQQADFTYRSDLWIDVILMAYVGGYLLVHWLVAINIYDRYLLVILPPTVLLIGRGIGVLEESVRLGKILPLLVICIILPTAWAVSEGRLPIGGDRGRHNGIEAVADYLNSQRLGAIVYDHWLGWELGYYMGTWSDKRRVYYPTPDALAADALLQADRAPRYFVVPAWADGQAWLTALRAEGFAVTETYQEQPFTVYELLPP